MLSILFIILVIMYLWFDTDAFIEYCSLLHIPFTKYKDFNKFKSGVSGLTYHSYLLMSHNNFFTRLITCPICFGAWINIIAWMLFFLPTELIAFNIIMTWIGYNLIRWTIKKLNCE